jgi:hypothetical protein
MSHFGQTVNYNTDGLKTIRQREASYDIDGNVFLWLIRHRWWAEKAMRSLV